MSTITRVDTSLTAIRRHVVPVVIPVASEEGLRSDTAVAAAYQRLAIHVFQRALEDLDHATKRHTAWEFLMARPDGLSDVDRLFAHWYGYIRYTLSVASIRRTASRAQRLVESGRRYTAATIWRESHHGV